jgi:3',5'-cyclic AMP phosphodiesterase CpdA
MKASASPPATDFSFAHLSDPHLTSLQGVRWQQLLNKRMLGYLSWRRRRRAEHRPEVLDALLKDLRQTRPEHVVITGDLTHVGLPQEFHQARLWLDRLGASDRVTVIPGNHDAYVRTAWDTTYAQWEPYMQSDPEYRTSDRAGHSMFPTLRVRDGVALIGLSSAVASPPFMATGTLGEAQLDRFAQLLRSTGRQGLFRLVLLHHPPRVEDEKWRKRLTDGRALCRILGEEGAELILHGHGHRYAESGVASRDGEIPVFGIPSASAIGHKPGRAAQYYVYRIRATAEGWSVAISVRGYHAETQEFVQARQHYLSVPAMPSTNC